MKDLVLPLVSGLVIYLVVLLGVTVALAIPADGFVAWDPASVALAGLAIHASASLLAGAVAAVTHRGPKRERTVRHLIVIVFWPTLVAALGLFRSTLPSEPAWQQPVALIISVTTALIGGLLADRLLAFRSIARSGDR